ncbi:MAG: hypothetical protein OES47_14475 [Acidobacteriota bacterium]|nr:hypothetical protein [Acidobacteriota bacterium]
MKQRSLVHPARRQNGEGKLGCTLWLLALAFFIYFAWQMFPAKMDALELESFIERRAEIAGINTSYGAKAIKKEILTRAEALEIPLDEDDVEINRTSTRVKIDCAYTVPIDLLFRDWDWEVEINVTRSVLR